MSDRQLSPDALRSVDVEAIEKLVETWRASADHIETSISPPRRPDMLGIYRQDMFRFRRCAAELLEVLNRLRASARDAEEPRTGEPRHKKSCISLTTALPCDCEADLAFIAYYRPKRHSSQPDQDKLELYRCKVCGTRWLLWPEHVGGGGWNLLDHQQRPGSCCDNAPMGEQIEHLRDIPLALPSVAAPSKEETSK